MTSPVRTYLAELHKIHAMGAGTGEVSLYNPLQNLLNEIGAKLRPKVFCIQNLKDLGAGFPDYGLYGANQLPQTDFGEALPAVIPERGEIVAGTRQVHHAVAVLHAPGCVADKPGRPAPGLAAGALAGRGCGPRGLGRAGGAKWRRCSTPSRVSPASPRAGCAPSSASWARCGALAAAGSRTRTCGSPPAGVTPARTGSPCPARARRASATIRPKERAALAQGAAALGLSLEAALACLGATTFDVHLNEEAYWANVPARVWAYSIGGYQVMKKWLSYREYTLLGRPLSAEEARYLTEVARRLTALCLLEPALDANYKAVTADPYPWPRTERERA